MLIHTKKHSQFIKIIATGVTCLLLAQTTIWAYPDALAPPAGDPDVYDELLDEMHKYKNLSGKKAGDPDEVIKEYIKQKRAIEYVREADKWVAYEIKYIKNYDGTQNDRGKRLPSLDLSENACQRLNLHIDRRKLPIKTIPVILGETSVFWSKEDVEESVYVHAGYRKGRVWHGEYLFKYLLSSPSNLLNRTLEHEALHLKDPDFKDNHNDRSYRKLVNALKRACQKIDEARLYESMVKEQIISPLASLCVGVHNEIKDKFKNYDITIRDSKALTAFIKNNAEQGLAVSFIRGILYVYGDRLKTEQEKADLINLIKTNQPKLAKLSKTPIDIDTIITASTPASTLSPLEVPEDLAEQIRFFTHGLSGEEKEAIDMLVMIMSDEEKMLSYIFEMDIAYLPYELKSVISNILLESLINHSDGGVRENAAKALGRLGIKDNEVVEALLDRLVNDEIGVVQSSSAEALGNLGIKNEEVINALVDSLRKDTVAAVVRESSAEALGKLRIKDKRAIEALLDKLKNDDWDNVRSASAEALGRLGVKGQKVINVLLNRLKNDNSGNVQISSAKALDRLLGVKDKRLINALLDRLKNDVDHIRASSAKALGSLRVKDKRIIDALLDRLINDDYFDVRSSSAEALGRLGVKDEKTVNALLDRLKKDTIWSVRSSSAEALVNLGVREKRVTDTLLDRLINDEWLVQRHLGKALTKLGLKDERVVKDIFLDKLRNIDEDVRKDSIKALGNLNILDEKVIDALLDRLKNDTDGQVRCASAEVLGNLGIKDKKIIDILVDGLVNDTDANVQTASAQALNKLFIQPTFEKHRGHIQQVVSANYARLTQAVTGVAHHGSAKDMVTIAKDSLRIGEVSVPIRKSADKEGVPDKTKTELVLTPTTVENMKKIAYSVNLNDPTLLIGPTATGKSAPIKYLAALTNNKHMAKSMNQDLTSYEVIGGYKPNPKKGPDEPLITWQDGFLITAMKQGYWLTLEELNLASTEVLELLNFYLVHGYMMITRDGKSEIITPHKDFRLFATMNPEDYSSRTKLSKALMGRFRNKYFGQLPDGELAEIINVRYGLSQDIGLRLLQLHHMIEKEAKEGDIGKKEKDRYEYNLRDLLKLCNRFKQDINKKGKVPLRRIAEELMNVYLDRIRDDNEKEALFKLADSVLGFSKEGITYKELTKKPATLDELNGLLTQLQGNGGEFVPGEDSLLAPVPTALSYMQKLAQTLIMNGRYKEFPLLVGPTASAKTSIVRYLAHLTNNNLHYINLNQDTAIEELIGGYKPTEKKGEYVWEDGLLVKAMEEGSWLFIDEFNMSELPEYFNTVLDDGYIILPNGRKVIAKESFRLIGAMNPPQYEGRNILSLALRSRMSEQWFKEEMPEKELRDIVNFYVNNIKISRLAVDLHNAIKDTFKNYDITIRDLMALKNFILGNKDAQNTPQAIIKGILYVYGDRLKTEKEKQDLITLLKSYQPKLTGLSKESIDIDEIITATASSSLTVPESPVELFRLLTQGLTGEEKEAMEIFGTILADEENIPCCLSKVNPPFLPHELKDVIADVLLDKSMSTLDDTTREYSAEAFGNLGVKDKKIINTLLKGLRNRNWKIQTASAQALGNLGIENKEVIDILLDGLNRDIVTLKASLKALCSLGVKDKRIIDVLTNTLDDSFKGEYVAQALCNLGVKDKRIIDILLDRLKSDSFFDRKKSAKLLGILGVKDKRVIDALLDRLINDDYSDVRSSSAEALANLGVKNKRIINALLDGLKSDSNLIREASVQRLAKLGVKDKRIISRLLDRLMHDYDEYVRIASTQALCNLGVKDKRVIDTLLKELRNPDNEYTLAVSTKMVGNLGVKDKRVIKKLLDNLRYFDDKVRVYSAEALCNLGVKDKKIIDILVNGLVNDTDVNVQTASAQALNKLFIQPTFEKHRGHIQQVVSANYARLTQAVTGVAHHGSAKDMVTIAKDSLRIGEVSVPIRKSADKEGVPDKTKTELVLTPTTVENMKKIAYSVNLNDPTLLIGPTATGKSAPIKYLAALTSNKDMAKSMNQDLTSYEAIGGYKPNPKKGPNEPLITWQDGFLITAMKQGYWLTLEELNLASTEVLELLNFYLVHGYMIITRDGKTETIHPHKDFRLFATMNPEDYSARTRLSKALLGRFRNKYLGPLPDGELAEIINVRYGLRQDIGLKLLQLHLLIEKEAKEGDIGKKEKDRYEYNLRDLLKLCNRFKEDINNEGEVPLRRIAEELMNVYLDRIRDDNEKEALFRVADTVLGFSKEGITYKALTKKPAKLDELTPLLTKLKGNGAGLVPGRDAILAPVPTTLSYIQKLAQTLIMNDKYKEFPLLVGLTASAKTSVVRWLAHLTNNNLHYINLNQDTAIEELIGGYKPTEIKGEYIWEDGLLVKAMEEGSWLFIDEFNMSELPEYFNTVIDDGYIILPNGRKVLAKESFRLIGAMNPPQYEGRNILSLALRSRMSEVWFKEEMPIKELKDIVNFYVKNRRISNITVELHNTIKNKFKNYDITIRDIMALKDFILENKDVQGNPQAIIRGILYVYGDRLKTEQEKAKLIALIRTHQPKLAKLSKEPIDIDAILTPPLPSPLAVPEGPVELFKLLTEGLSGEEEEAMALLNTMLSKEEDIPRYLSKVDISYLPSELKDIIVEILLDGLMDDTDEVVRRYSAEALGRLGVKDERIKEALLDRLMDDADVAVRGDSAVALGRLGVKDERIIDALLDRLMDDADVAVQIASAEALGRLGVKDERIKEALLDRLMNDTNERVRRNSAEALGRLGVKDERIIDTLLDRLMNDTDGDVQVASAEALARLGIKDKRIIDTLLDSLIKDTDVVVRRKSAVALGRLGVKDKRTIKALLGRLMNDIGEFVQISSAEVLGRLGVKDERIIEALLDRLMKDTYGVVRRASAEALGRLGVKDKRIIDTLLDRLMNDTDADVKVACGQALSTLLIQPTLEKHKDHIAQVVSENYASITQPVTGVAKHGSAKDMVVASKDSLRIGEVTVAVRESTDKEGVPDKKKTELILTPATVENLKKISYAANLNDPLLLIGPTATGKSAPIKYLAALTNNRHMAKSMNQDLTSYEAIGGYKPNPKKGPTEPLITWQDGFLITAMKQGYWLTLEELNLASTEVLELLNFYLVHGYMIITRDGKTETIHPHKDFRLFATMNPEDYSSRTKLSKALMGRFRNKYLGPLPDGELAEIINVRYGLSQDIGLKLLQLHHLIEKEAKEGDIGKKEKDRYEYNLRDLLKLCNRFKEDINNEGEVPLRRIAEELMNVYLDRIRDDNEKEALFTVADTVLGFSKQGITYQDLTKKPTNLKELNDLLTELKGNGGELVPGKDSILAPVPTTLSYIQKLAQTLIMNERYKEFPLLVGPTASAKTSVVRYLAHLTKNNLHYINLNQDTAIEELIGGYKPTEIKGEYIWEDGLLVKAMEEGSWLFIDEFNMSELPEYFNTVIDDGYIILPNGRKVIAKESFRLIGAMNPPEYEGRNILSLALRSRMSEAWFKEEMPLEEQEEIAKFLLIDVSGAEEVTKTRWADSLGKEAIARGLISPDLVKTLGGDLLYGPSGGYNFAAPLSIKDSIREIVGREGRVLSEEEFERIIKRVDRMVTQVQIVARAISEDAKLNFRPGRGWSYDYDTNTITYPLEILLTGKDPDECVIGSSIHEGSHRDISRVSLREEVFRSFFSREALRFLLNGFEDPRANNWAMRKYGGSDFYLDKLYDRYYPKEGISEDFEGRLEGAEMLPHEEYIFGTIYYWRHGETPPWMKDQTAIKAFEDTKAHFKDIWETLPEDIRASEKEKMRYAVEMAEKVREHILPMYEKLLKESIQRIGQAIKDGKVKVDIGEGEARPGAISPDELSEEARKIIEQRAKELADRLEGKIGRPDLKKAREGIKESKRRLAEGGEEEAAKEEMPIKSIIDAMKQRKRLLRELESRRSDYAKVYAKIAPLIEHLKGILENIFTKNMKPRYTGYFRSGTRIDIRKLIQFEMSYNLDDRIWKRKKLPSKRDYKFTLLLDESGSMSGEKGERAIEAMALFLEALEHVGIDYSIVGFSDSVNEPPHKGFGTKLDEAKKEGLLGEVETCMGNGCTADADGLKYAIDEISKQPGERKIVIVLTDGEGNINTTGMGFDEIQKYAERKGVEVIGVGIGEGITYVKANYHIPIQVPNIEELPLAVAEVLAERIVSESRIAEKARIELINKSLSFEEPTGEVAGSSAGMGFLHRGTAPGSPEWGDLDWNKGMVEVLHNQSAAIQEQAKELTGGELLYVAIPKDLIPGIESEDEVLGEFRSELDTWMKKKTKCRIIYDYTQAQLEDMIAQGKIEVSGRRRVRITRDNFLAYLDSNRVESLAAKPEKINLMTQNARILPLGKLAPEQLVQLEGLANMGLAFLSMRPDKDNTAQLDNLRGLWNGMIGIDFDVAEIGELIPLMFKEPREFILALIKKMLLQMPDAQKFNAQEQTEFYKHAAKFLKSA